MMEDLIYFIVDELYGKDPGTVARTLYLKNKSTFKQIQTTSSLPEQRLRNALVVLLQQQIITLDEKPKQTYSITISEVLKRLRFPRYIRLIHQKFGENSCIEEILENGSVSLNFLLESCKLTHKSPEQVSAVLREMILNDYLVSCDHKPELTQNIINISNLPKQGRPKKKAKIEIPSDSLKIKEALPTRPLETLSEAFYKLNTSKLDKEMTSELISKYVSSKTTLNSAIISEVFYKLGYRSVTKAEIMSQLPKVPKLSSEAVETCLEQLEKSSIIENDSEISWRINLPQIFNNLSAFTLEKIIQGKFGDYAGRVFRILYNKGLLDDKNISDLTLLPLRETNSCLNELFSAGFVFSKTVGASQMYYGVKIDDVREDLLRQCFKSVLNLKIKLASEMEEVWGLVQRAGHLTADEKHALERYKIIEARIESAILELDRTILVLSLH